MSSYAITIYVAQDGSLSASVDADTEDSKAAESTGDRMPLKSPDQILQLVKAVQAEAAGNETESPTEDANEPPGMDEGAPEGSPEEEASESPDEEAQEQASGEGDQEDAAPVQSVKTAQAAKEAAYKKGFNSQRGG